MNYLVRVALFSCLLVIVRTQSYAKAFELTPNIVSEKFQKAFNNNDLELLGKMLANVKKTSLNNRYKNFIEEFPDAKWVVNHLETLGNGTINLEILTNAERISEDQSQTLKARQVINLKLLKDKIVSTNIISQQSIIQNSANPLSIKLNAPERVLTGSIYDIDLILNKPLGNNLIAGGIVALTKEHLNENKFPKIKIRPLGGGGLFKSVKAPLNPGIQNWAIVIAHPQSIISATKTVNIVNELETKKY